MRKILFGIFGAGFFFLGVMMLPATSYAATCAISGTATLDQAYINSNSCDTINVSGTFVLTVSGTVDLVGDGSLNITSGTVTLSGAVVLGSTDDFTISSGATVTHAAEDTVGVNITAENITVSGFINTNSKGCRSTTSGNSYGPHATTGVCTQAATGYAVTGTPDGSGGSHGGLGGLSSASTRGGTTNGSSTAPVFLGSGGGGSTYGSGVLGGYGGGKIRLDVTGALTNSGTISSNGGAGIMGNASYYGGGGSGGSVYITTGSLAGAGTITATGGSSTGGAAGGGGRVAVYYDTNSSFTLTNITAAAGTGANSGSTAGTTFILNRKTDDGIGDLTITSGLNFESTGDYVRANITAANGALLTCDTFATLNVGATSTLAFQGVTWTCATIDTVNISAATWTTSGTNTISINKAGAVVDWNITNDLTLNNLTYTGATAGTTSASGGVLSLDNAINVVLVNTDMNTSLNWTGLSSLNMDATSSLAADSKGCQSTTSGNSYGPHATTGVCTQAATGYAVTGTPDGSGGSHGGLGGLSSASTRGGTTNGSSTAPVFLGSGGGGSTYGSGVLGGYGGGKIRLDVTGALTNSGIISSNGGVGNNGDATYYGGGGSGGSVYITTGSIAGAGTITATGGTSTGGAAGGGGRVAVYYGTNVSFTLGNITAAAGTGVNSGSTAGTTYTLQVVSLASITITDNSGYTNDSTPVITAVSSGATPTHIAFSCNGGSNWSSWITYPDDDVANDGDGPAFDMTLDATGCSATNELKTISAKIKDASSESSSVSDTTTYDTAAPTVSSVSSSNANATYGAGEVITVTVLFTESMSVSGTPLLQLDMDGTDRNASYASTSTATLSFTYTIVTGDNKADLDYTGTTALSLNSGTITDLAGNTATLTLASPGAANSLGANKNIVIVTNQVPTASLVTLAQTVDASGNVTITFHIDDPDNDNTLQAKVEYSINSGSSWADPTLSTTGSDTSATFGDPSVDNAQTYQVGQSGAYILTSSGENTVSIVWNAATDLSASTDLETAKIRVTPYDGTITGTAVTSSDGIIDFVAPTGLSSITNGNASALSVQISWNAVTGNHFSHYELWYASIGTDAQNRTGGAIEWDDSDDALLATISTTSSIVSGNLQNKYAVLFAVDDYGNSISSGTPLLIQPPHSRVGPQTSQTTQVSYGVTISAPSANSTYVTGENLSISWGQTGAHASFVDIYYSLDGTLYNPIARNQNAATATYNWDIPDDVYGEQVTIRIDLTDLIIVLATNSSETFSITSESGGSTESTDSQSGSSGSYPTGTYIRGESWPTVYYIDGQARRPFLDSQTYFTYESDFSRVVTIADSSLSLYALGVPMLPKPGSILLKIQSVPRVYITDSSGALHWITTEEIADSLFGDSWAEYVIDVPVTAWPHFTFGAEITSADSFSIDTTLLKTRQEVSK